jgi:hypothetical protein
MVDVLVAGGVEDMDGRPEFGPILLQFVTTLLSKGVIPATDKFMLGQLVNRVLADCSISTCTASSAAPASTRPVLVYSRGVSEHAEHALVELLRLLGLDALEPDTQRQLLVSPLTRVRAFIYERRRLFATLVDCCLAEAEASSAEATDNNNSDNKICICACIMLWSKLKTDYSGVKTDYIWSICWSTIHKRWSTKQKGWPTLSKTIDIHPLVTTPYNADFDGDMILILIYLLKKKFMKLKNTC